VPPTCSSAFWAGTAVTRPTFSSPVTVNALACPVFVPVSCRTFCAPRSSPPSTSR
jgi:hypothetical protein